MGSFLLSWSETKKQSLSKPALLHAILRKVVVLVGVPAVCSTFVVSLELDILPCRYLKGFSFPSYSKISDRGGFVKGNGAQLTALMQTEACDYRPPISSYFCESFKNQFTSTDLALQLLLEGQGKSLFV
jgi:hypothetical protein